MNLATLKDVCASYHQKVPADLTQNSVDLFLVAANNARKRGEKLHTFEDSRCTAKLDVDGALGGQLSFARISPSGVFAKIKEVIGASVLRANGIWSPIDFTRADIEKERERSDIELDEYMGFGNRYPSDSQFIANKAWTKLVQRGNTLYFFPETEDLCNVNNPGCGLVTVKLECNGFLRDYVVGDLTNDAEFDYFLSNGDEYLQWAIIWELNHIYQTFVPRQEGNVVSSPKDLRDEAWRDLLLWDAYKIDAHVTRTK